MNRQLCRQLAIDYCCREEEAADSRNHFSLYERREGRRRFREAEECFLKIAVVNGKILFAGAEGILSWCRERFSEEGGEWFFEQEKLRLLEARLREDGYEIDMVHPFFIPKNAVPSSKTQASAGPAFLAEGGEIKWYRGEEIEAFRGDGRFSEAYGFSEEAPDVIGAAAIQGGEILGMAGASADSPYLWQIGIDVLPEARGKGIGTFLVSLLSEEILREGRLPYYGTSFSHLASQRVALEAGFYPAWVELSTRKKRA